MNTFSRTTARTVLIFIALMAGAGVYLWSAKGIRYYSVQSGSMSPSINTGDLVIDKPLKMEDVNLGDVISYASLSDHQTVISHRVIKKAGNRQLITQGDNSSLADPPVDFGAVQGRVVKVIPAAGYVMDTLKTPLGLLILVYVPAIIIAAAELRAMYNRLSEPYKHPKLI